MQLSKLEIKGFKSFGDKVTINFDQGITGIVGPNGCGKSNVVDSIRWVLGEQKTRNLRSDKMENIIFNGTKNRKALQFAEVSISFNNTKNLLPTEYSAVTITRRYYRSGESEYLLNNVVCRLKDINNLFLDTGIGPDSYAIIELKMIDEILNDKDNSRRNLFEEAAGISKFKIRKKETLRKLEDTDADLSRVEDLLFEIEKNMKSLEKQAKQTEKYFHIKDDYKKHSIQLAGKTIQKNQEKINQLKKALETEQSTKISLNSQIAGNEAQIAQEKTDLVNREKLLSSRQKTLNEQIAKIRHFESEKKIKNERLRYLNETLVKLHEQIEIDKKSNDRADFSIKSIEEERNSVEKQFLELEVLLADLKIKVELEKQKQLELQEKAQVFQNQQKKSQNEVFQTKKSIEILEVQIEAINQEIDKNSFDNEAHKNTLIQLQSQIKQSNELILAKEQNQNLLLEKEQELETKAQELESEIEKLKEQNVVFNRRLDARQNEFNLTKSLVDNLEGFPDAVRFLKKNTQWGKETPLLSDILTCDEQYRVAIENYLENYMNFYVVENEAMAIQAVQLLSESTKGRANFFISSKFDNFNAAEKREIANATQAIELVEYDEKYQKLIQYLLNDVYILTQNQDELPDSEAIIITQNGKIAKKKRTISGGSVGLFEGKRIGRAKNLEKLEKDIVVLQEKIKVHKENLNEKIELLKSLKSATFKPEIEKAQKEIQLLKNELLSTETKKEQLDILLANTSGKKEELLEKRNQAKLEVEKLNPLLLSIQENLLEVESEINELNKDLLVCNAALQNLSNDYNQKNIQFHQLQNKIESLNQEVTYKKNAFEHSQNNILKNTEELQKVEQEIKNMLSKAEVSEEELVSLYQEKDAIEGGLSEAEKEYYANRSTIETLEKNGKELQKTREGIDLKLVEINGQINEEKINLTALNERLSVEFEVNLSQISEEEFKTELAEKELQQKIQNYKNQLDKLGPINPMALEAYQEIKQRFDFISAQKLDLVNAKKSLLSTISEIDVVAKDTFNESFHAIRENFIKVFRSLFSSEDSCDLKLTNPSDPTESAIEIIARPKGKKPLTINQLSGGEKTLTAISLLFAIYLLKPAPFCIFDEVDAPLDDANIDKFNNIIRTFSADSQFVIVTHNKRTMASTDIIYGVTMLEQGVSRVIPVDLRSLE